MNRIKIILLLLLVHAGAVAQITNTVHSGGLLQDRFSPTEILAGVGLVSIDWTPIDQYRQDVFSVGYTLGLGKSYLVSDRVLIEGKVLFEKKGGKQYEDEQTTDYVTNLPVLHKGAITTEYTLNCITVPVTACYQFGNKTKFQFRTGLYFSYLLNATYNVKSTVTPSLHYSGDVSNQLSNDFGYCLGVGVQLPGNHWKGLSLQIFSSGGLKNIWQANNPQHPRDWRANSVYLIIGYPLRKTK